MGAVASLLLTHDAAFDEHHHSATFEFVIAQAISSGHRQRLTLFEGLTVPCFHVGHHVAHAPLLLLGKSGAADTDGDEDSNNQGVHACLLFPVWLQVYDAVEFKQFLMLSPRLLRAMDWAV